MNPQYRFFLEIGEDSALSYPLHDSLKLKYKKGSKQAFFRAELSGKLRFVKSDYDRILAAAFDTVYKVRIQKQNEANEYVDFFTGKFTRTMCKINQDDKILETKLETVDLYEDVLAGLEKEFDLIKLSPEIKELKYYKRPILQIYTPGEKVISCFAGGLYWEQECDAISDLTALNTQHGFNSELKSVLPFSKGDVVVFADWYKQGAFTSREVTEVKDAYKATTHNADITLKLGTTKGDYTVSLDLARMRAFLDSDLGHSEVDLTRENNQLKAAFSSWTFYIMGVSGPGKSFVNRLLHDNDSFTGTKVNILNKAEFGDNRNYKYATPLDWSTFDIRLYASAEISAEPTEYGQRQPGEYYKKPRLAGVLGLGALVPISKSQWGDTSFWFINTPMQGIVDSEFGEQNTLKHAYPLYSCISRLLNEVAPEVTFEGSEEYSSFLYSQRGITGEDPVSSRYYSGHTLYMTQITNILKGEYDQPAQKMPMTLKKIFDMLKNCFKCYWFIDGNKLRIEHIKYFNSGLSEYGSSVGLDATGVIDSRTGKLWSFASSEYEYDFEDMPEYFQFKWPNDVTKPFEGWPLEIKSNYVKKGQIEEVAIAGFSTDLDFMLWNPGSFNEDGNALIAALPNGNVYYQDQFGEVTFFMKTFDPYGKDEVQYSLQNGVLSFFNLVPSYYIYDLPGSNAIINTLALDADYQDDTVKYNKRVKRTKKQKIKYPKGLNINPYKLVRTELGVGQIEEYEVDLSSEVAEITVYHDTE